MEASKRDALIARIKEKLGDVEVTQPTTLRRLYEGRIYPADMSYTAVPGYKALAQRLSAGIGDASLYRRFRRTGQGVRGIPRRIRRYSGADHVGTVHRGFRAGCAYDNRTPTVRGERATVMQKRDAALMLGAAFFILLCRK